MNKGEIVMNIVIVSDDREQLHRITRMILSITNSCCVSEFVNMEKVLQYIYSHDVDLIFVDVSLMELLSRENRWELEFANLKDAMRDSMIYVVGQSNTGDQSKLNGSTMLHFEPTEFRAVIESYKEKIF